MSSQRKTLLDAAPATKRSDSLTPDTTVDRALSRRGLLAGSVGLGTLAMARPAVAQSGEVQNVSDRPASGDGAAADPRSLNAVDIARHPTDVPAPIGDREPKTVQIDLEAIELEGQLDTSTVFRYWTFNGKVPGPLLRVRVGDTVEINLRNRADNMMTHNIDLHAVNGPGGGAKATTTHPGEEQAFRFKALNPGLFIYHCAVPPVAHHISNGMYGMILVEPEGGLPPVDREFYVMQGEIYTAEPYGTSGTLNKSYDKLLNEAPEYYVFNGSVGALTERHPLKANVGDNVRIFFGVGGPNKASSFHVIGEIFDRYYPLGSAVEAIDNIHVINTPAGGTAITDFKLQVPGRYVLVDHALSRVERGLAGWLDVEGPENTEIFDPMPTT